MTEFIREIESIAEDKPDVLIINREREMNLKKELEKNSDSQSTSNLHQKRRPKV
jgi:hypothetical protein